MSSSVDCGLPSSIPLGGVERSLFIFCRRAISIISTLAFTPTCDHMSAIVSRSCLSLTIVPYPACIVSS